MDDLRSRIVEAAAELLDAQGWQTSTRAIAAAAGTQVPTLYRLFGDKEGLLAAVAEHGHAAYLATKPPIASEADPVDALRAGWDRHVEFGLSHPTFFQLMYANPTPGRPSAAAAAARAVLDERIRAIAAAGRLRVSPQLAADLVHAAGTGVVLAQLALPAAARTPALSATAFGAVAAAITTDGPRQPDPGAVPAANALRSALPDLDRFSPAERLLLGEWLERIADGARVRPPGPAR